MKKKKGNPAAKQLVFEIGHCLGVGLANLNSILDPELILVSGGMSQHLSAFLPSVEQAFQRYVSPMTRKTPIRRAKLGNQAGVLGALRLCF